MKGRGFALSLLSLSLSSLSPSLPPSLSVLSPSGFSFLCSVRLRVHVVVEWMFVGVSRGRRGVRGETEGEEAAGE